MPPRRRSARLASIEEDLIKDGLRSALATVEGRRFIWRLFEWTHILSNSRRETDAATYFALGEQNIGQQLLGLLEEADPEAWLKLRNEQLEMLEALRASNEEEETDDE